VSSGGSNNNVTVNCSSGGVIAFQEGGTAIATLRDNTSYGELNMAGATGSGVITAQFLNLSGSTYVLASAPLGVTRFFANTGETSLYAGANGDTTTSAGLIKHAWNGTGGLRKVERGYGRVQTTDDTTTTVYTSPTLPNGSTVQVDVVLIGCTNGGSPSASYRRMLTIRTTGGSMTFVGSTTQSHTAEDNAAWDITLSNSGATFLVRATGAAATNINWECYVTIYYAGSYA